MQYFRVAVYWHDIIFNLFVTFDSDFHLILIYDVPHGYVPISAYHMKRNKFNEHKKRIKERS